MQDRHDFADARRDLIAPIPNGQVRKPDGRVIFDLADHAYLSDDAPRPDTVDASLWRTSQVIHTGGLYKAVDRPYQVRNNDIANVTKSSACGQEAHMVELYRAGPTPSANLNSCSRPPGRRSNARADGLTPTGKNAS